MNANNTPPVVQPGQPQPIPLTPDMIAVLSQRIIQMTQSFGCSKLTNGNGSNFWDQFLACALLIASCNTVCLHNIIFMPPVI